MKISKQALPCPRIKPGQRKFTSRQEAYARQFTQERIAAMLSTTVLDEAEAERHLRNAYRAAGIEPVPVRWFDSPVSFVVASIGGRIGKRLWEKLWSRAHSDIWNRVLPTIPPGDKKRTQCTHLDWWHIRQARIQHSVWSGGVKSNVLDPIQDQVRNRIGRIAWSGIMNSFEDSLGECIWTNERDSYNLYGDKHLNGFGEHIWRSVRDSVQAYEEEAIRSFDRFFHEIFEENPLIHLALFNEMVSGFLLGSDEAWLVRKPLRLELDEQGHLHSENGMCMQYRDGWGFYAWHGVCVRAQVILHPERLTREEWINEQNVEIQRIIQERLGPERFIALAGGISLHRSQHGELIAVVLKDDTERVAHYVHVQDSSSERKHYVRVPPTIQNADEAVAWTVGMSGQEYRPG